MLSKSVLDTKKIAKDIFLTTKSNLYLIKGDLGVGKTVFVKGIIGDEANSPSFQVKSVYLDKKNKFIHYDLYLIDLTSKNINQMISLILEDIDEGVVLIEWPEKLKKIPFDNYIEVNIERINDLQRKIEYEVK